jgi:hypothetical protein
VTHRSCHDSLDHWDWERIPADVDAVLFRWFKQIRETAPWCAMPTDDALGQMRPVVSELLNEGYHPSDGRHALRLSGAARTHGRFRRRQRCDWPAVATEIDALVEAFRAALIDAKQPPGIVRDSLVVFEAELRLVHEFALIGWEDATGRVSLAT